MTVNHSKNILITSSGRKVVLLKLMKNMAKRYKCNVYAADFDATAPTLQIADKSFIVPKIKSKQYIPTLLDISKKNKIGLIIPLEDSELPIFSSKIGEFSRNNIKVMICRKDSIKIAIDKLRTFEFFTNLQIPTPETLSVEQMSAKTIASKLGFPLILKPRKGDGSKGIILCNNLDDLNFYLKNSRRIIAQKFVRGIEVTIDIFGDGTGKVLSAVPRKRLKIRAGEVERAITVDYKIFEETVNNIMYHFKPYGPINLQCIVTSKGPVFTEINARFGGGYPLSDKSGAKFPELIMDLFINDLVTTRIDKYEKGLVMCRYDDAIYSDVSIFPNSQELSSLKFNDE